MAIARADTFIAIDLGALSGRITIGRFQNGRLSMNVAYRFPHAPELKDGHIRWNWEIIWHGIEKGLFNAAQALVSQRIHSISCSSWAQDFGLLDEKGRLFSFPISYRDPMTSGLPGAFSRTISADDLVRRTGSGAYSISTLCQLYALSRKEPELFKKTSRLLHIADLVHYLLCGTAVAEKTLASVSALLRLGTGQWDIGLMDILGIPKHFLPEITEHPDQLGAVSGKTLSSLFPKNIPVAISAGHDTAAAAELVPHDPETLFISSGTWSMMGCFTEKPLITENPSRHGCWNAQLASGQWMFMRGMAGMRIFQACGFPGFPAQIPAPESIIDPDDPRFANPPDMTEEIKKACRETGQKAPKTLEEIAATIFAGMTCNYLFSARLIENLTKRKFTRLFVSGGGSGNALLSQMTADTLGISVMTGPIEATSAGNILIQAKIAGLMENKEPWQIAEISFQRALFIPEKELDRGLYERFLEIRQHRRTHLEVHCDDDS